MLPPPPAFMARPSARMLRKLPHRLVSMQCSNCSLVNLSREPAAPSPAELTARSRRPKRSTVAATAASTDSSSVTSHATQAAFAPSCSTAAASVSSRRAQIITAPPPSTIAWAQPKPMPVAPAVTNPTLPSNRDMCIPRSPAYRDRPAPRNARARSPCDRARLPISFDDDTNTRTSEAGRASWRSRCRVGERGRRGTRSPRRSAG